jgi:hypothetical protein
MGAWRRSRAEMDYRAIRWVGSSKTTLSRCGWACRVVSCGSSAKR